MKPRVAHQKTAALTVVEVLVALAVLAILATIALAILQSDRRNEWRRGFSCSNNLRGIGLSFRDWAGDYNDKYPMRVSMANGGAMELVATGNVVTTFQVMSNELSTPKMVICPQDMSREPATNFTTDFNSRRISYFVNVDADEKNPQTVFSGDANFEISGVPVKSGLLRLSPNVSTVWTATRHKSSGYFLFGDGSVQGMSNAGLSNYFNAGPWTNRLAIP